MPSVKQVCNALADNQDAVELRKLLEAIRVDLAVIRANQAALVVDVDAIITAAATNIAAVAGLTSTAAAPAALTVLE